MTDIDTSKVKTIAGEMIDINNRHKDDFSAVEQAINRLKSDWQQPANVASAAFACFDEIKSKYFESSIEERRQLAQYLCDAVGIGYEEVENTNKKLLEQLFDIVGTVSSTIVSAENSNTSTETIRNESNIIDSYCQTILGEDLGGKEYAYYKEDGKIYAWQCHAFVNDAWKNIYGYDTYDGVSNTTSRCYDYSKLAEYIKANASVGDILRFSNDNNNYKYQHSVLIQDISETGITVYEYGGARHNYADGPVKETYTWQALQDRWQNKDNYFYLYQLNPSVKNQKRR